MTQHLDYSECLNGSFLYKIQSNTINSGGFVATRITQMSLYSVIGFVEFVKLYLRVHFIHLFTVQYVMI